MLGSVADAEDVVQEAFLRYHAAEVDPDSPKAYLATITTRLAIDQLRSARTQREAYPGQWLPEPLAEEDASQHAEMADSLSLAFLHLLEKLSPVERAVFLLREVFDYPHEDVARIVGKSTANSRQILARAHAHMDEGRRRFEVSRAEREEVARRFLEAWESGDTEGLVAVLAPDAAVYGDGGGKARAIREPLVGALRVAKALVGWRRLALDEGVTYRAATVNGAPGVVYSWPDGSVAGVQELEIADGVVVAVRTVLNPDKLAHLSVR
jgi:RNA polymerase sigma-70 factor (ECF subfamily)